MEVIRKILQDGSIELLGLGQPLLFKMRIRIFLERDGSQREKCGRFATIGKIGGVMPQRRRFRRVGQSHDIGLKLGCAKPGNLVEFIVQIASLDPRKIGDFPALGNERF